MAHYTKALVAFLTALVGIIALWWPPVATYVSPEVLNSVAAIAGTFLVYLLPNRPA